MNRTFHLLLGLLLLTAQAPNARAAAAAQKKPNIVLFLVDDMGWMDCGAYGSRYYKTPNIDAFARQSMRFTDAYSMPLCSPTRASILSGQYTARHGITSATGHLAPAKAFLRETAPPNAPLLLPESGTYLDPAHYTLAEALRDQGYKTAHIGKWHLGTTKPHWPEAQGFDFTFHCHPDAGPPGAYFSPYGVTPIGSQTQQEKGVKRLVGNITDGPQGEYIVDRQAIEAERFIDANKDSPFFLNLWCYGVHGPWGHKESLTAEFAKTQDPTGLQGNPIMASMLKSVDECFGRILAKLDALGIAENTIVLFTSDNGGNIHSNTSEDEKNKKGQAASLALENWRRWAGTKPPTNNSPLRDGKGRLYEGGTRVPLLVRWPGKIAPATTSDAVVGCIDVYPTVMELAGLPLPAQQKIDGVSYANVLRGTGKLQRDAYFIWFPHLVPGVSVRQGDWKLIRRFVERAGEYEGVHELFNLSDDLGETKNLAAQMPDKVQALNTLIDAFVRDTGALYPKPNPAYRPQASKPQAAGGGAPSGNPAEGLVARFCRLTPADGFLRVETDGRTPFLGTAQIRAKGPFTLKLRARSAVGGPCRIQWTTSEQTEFAETGQTVEFHLLGNEDWQDTAVEVPLNGESRIVRLYLPADKAPVEVGSIEYSQGGKPLKSWTFYTLKKQPTLP